MRQLAFIYVLFLPLKTFAVSNNICTFVIGMKFNTRNLILTILFVCSANSALMGQSMTDSLLTQLDDAISNRDLYLNNKEARLSELHSNLMAAQADSIKFDILGTLFAEYHSFNADSAYAMAQRRLCLAGEIGDRNLVINAMLNKANILNLVGMYHESMTLVDSVEYDELPEYLRAYYFHTKRTLYGNLANFATFGPERARYERLTDQYRDSLLTVNDPNSVFYALIKADQLNVHNRPKEAIDLLEGFIRNNDLSEHDLAICAYTLSEAYGYVNDTANQKKQLLIDRKSVV